MLLFPHLVGGQHFLFFFFFDPFHFHIFFHDHEVVYPSLKPLFHEGNGVIWFLDESVYDHGFEDVIDFLFDLDSFLLIAGHLLDYFLIGKA